MLQIKDKKELTFLAVGTLMLFIALFLGIQAVGFLAKNLYSVFGSSSQAQPALKFNLEKAEAIKK